ncbi:MAG: hypothetical protein M5U35_04615 [Roseovarius sp.]|nr:hypothetical protein [Roseovarius sp.]
MSGRERWRFFRELCSAKWSEAFVDKVQEMTGRRAFTHVTAVSRIHGDRAIWENHPPFQVAMQGNPVKLLAFHDMLRDIEGSLTTTLASTEVGRMMQMFRAAGLKLS